MRNSIATGGGLRGGESIDMVIVGLRAARKNFDQRRPIRRRDQRLRKEFLLDRLQRVIGSEAEGLR